MNYNWIALVGRFEMSDKTIVFKGGTHDYSGRPGPELGNFLCDQKFGGGTISAEIEFTKISDKTACEIILFHDPTTNYFVTAGLGSGPMFAVRHYGTEWSYLSQVGSRENLEVGKTYKLRVSLKGSRVSLNVNGVDVLSTNLRFPLGQSQVGIWAMDYYDIKISKYEVERETPKVFVVMQFTTPYNELYSDVIEKICEEEFKLDAFRADETYGPGLIIADVIRQIIESKFIIADITPANPNVFYEVGFAHALNKPTILIAEKPSELPFDVSGFRVLLYEDSIRGKAKIEEGLRKHIQAILTEYRA